VTRIVSPGPDFERYPAELRGNAVTKKAAGFKEQCDFLLVMFQALGSIDNHMINQRTAALRRRPRPIIFCNLGEYSEIS